jgi:hypothetical protein
MALTGKQQAFVNAYLGAARFNATEAARLAGYKGDDVTLRNVAKENLTKPYIKTAIAEFWNANAMTAEETLHRLADMARGDIGDFLSTFTVTKDGKTKQITIVDMEKVKANGRLVKSITQTKLGPRIELYDARAALVDIGRYHKMFTDKTEQTSINIDYTTLTDKQLERIARGDNPLDVITGG